MAARTIAVVADFLQIIMFPFFLEGILSPLEVLPDLAVAASLTALVGWHIVFLPTFLVEQLPLADLAPTWTIAVIFATRGTRGG